MEKITAVIIDDEQRARNVLETLIKENIPEIEILALAEDVPSGVKAINKCKPDLVFLDIEMPGYNGFQLLDFFEDIHFDIIFTTAYSEYALQAFQVSAIDYLLKPLQIDHLVKAVEKVKLQSKQQVKEKLETLRSNSGEKGIQKIALPVSKGLLFVEIDSIVYLEADGSYCYFHLTNGQKILVSKKIKEFEQVLNSDRKFFRPHRSYIINIAKVAEYHRQDGGSIFMEGGAHIPLSREMKENFLQLVGQTI